MHPFEDILQVNEGTEEQREKNNDLIEGDIKKDPDAKGDDNVKRNALRDRNRLWHTRDIAYTIKQDGSSAQGKDKDFRIFVGGFYSGLYGTLV